MGKETELPKHCLLTLPVTRTPWKAVPSMEEETQSSEFYLSTMGQTPWKPEGKHIAEMNKSHTGAIEVTGLRKNRGLGLQGHKTLDGEAESCAKGKAPVPGHAHMPHATAAVQSSLLNASEQTDENCDTGQPSKCFHVNLKSLLVRAQWLF